MLVIGGAILGTIIGALTARKRGGTGLDMAQYAAGYGIAFALIALVATVMIHRTAL